MTLGKRTCRIAAGVFVIATLYPMRRAFLAYAEWRALIALGDPSAAEVHQIELWNYVLLALSLLVLAVLSAPFACQLPAAATLSCSCRARLHSYMSASARSMRFSSESSASGLTSTAPAL